MQLLHEFTVPVGVEETWAILTNIERIAPCMPGAELLEVGDGTYRGEIRVKVGPITSRYQGHAVFVERDEERLRAVLQAEGRDPKGHGNATALISAALSPTAAGTLVNVTTDLHITGRVAQFGRGVLSDVSGRLMDEFARALEVTLLRGGDEEDDAVTILPAPPEPGEPSSAPRPATAGHVPGPASTPAGGELALLGAAAGPVLRRVLPIVAGGALIWFCRRRARRPTP